MLQYEFFKVMKILVILFFSSFFSNDLMSQIKKEKEVLNSKISNKKKTTSKLSPAETSPGSAKSINVLENKSNIPPTVSILDINKTLQLPTSSTSFSATAYDEDGSIISTRWEKVSGNDCIITGENSSTLYISNLSKGSYSFKFTVTDNKGATTTDFANIVVKSAVPQIISSPSIITKNENPPKLKGGAPNALLNLLLPGLGHFFVSGDHHGKNKKAGSLLITLGYLASAGLGVSYKLKSNTAYNSYLDLANNKEYQRDASGNVIGLRSPSNVNAVGLFNDAVHNNNNFKILLMVSGGILATDFIYTLIKGSKNKRNYNKEYNTKVSFDYNPISKQYPTISPNMDSGKVVTLLNNSNKIISPLIDSSKKTVPISNSAKIISSTTDSSKKVVPINNSTKIVSPSRETPKIVPMNPAKISPIENSGLIEISDIMFGKNMTTGIIHVDVPENIECTISIYTSPDHTLLYNSRQQRNFSLFQGTYDVEISGMVVKKIPVYKALDTRIKAGALNITSALPWTLYDENKSKKIFSSSLPGKVEFPKGIYQLEIKSVLYQIEIKDGETLHYNDILSTAAQPKLNTDDSNKIIQPQKLNAVDSNKNKIIKPKVPIIPSLSDNKYWEIKQNSTAKGANGRILLNIPKEIESIITISQSVTEKEVHYSGILTKERSFSLAPGIFNITISGSKVKHVPVQKGMDTRIKAGVLNVTSSGIWTLYNEKKNKEVYYSSTAKKIGLPVGIYQMELNGTTHQIIIKDGATLNF